MRSFLILIFFLIGCLNANAQKKLSSSEADFEKFWLTFKNHYAFFDLKGVNWDSSYTKYRHLVNKGTTENELLAILEQMVEPLQDEHVSILRGDDFIYSSKKESFFKKEFKGLRKEFWDTVFLTLIKKGFDRPQGVGPVFRGENLYYVAQNSEIAYLRISRCYGEFESLFDTKKEKKDSLLMLRLLDSLLHAIPYSKGLIVDIRANGGGHAGAELARRFLTKKTLTHYISTKLPGSYDHFTPLEPVYLEPSVRPYTKPLVILTNDKTESSAEDFALSLSQRPQTTFIGTNTSGTFSDMFVAKLAHKLSFTLSNQRYYSITKVLLEDLGVEVNIQIRNTRQDFNNGADHLILNALEVLRTN